MFKLVLVVVVFCLSKRASPVEDVLSLENNRGITAQPDMHSSEPRACARATGDRPTPSRDLRVAHPPFGDARRRHALKGRRSCWHGGGRSSTQGSHVVASATREGAPAGQPALQVLDDGVGAVVVYLHDVARIIAVGDGRRCRRPGGNRAGGGRRVRVAEGVAVGPVGGANPPVQQVAAKADVAEVRLYGLVDRRRRR